MGRRKFVVEIPTTVTVEFDSSLLPDKEWRETFYNICTLQQLAEHFAYNRIANGIEDISMLDGFADQEESTVKMRVAFGEAEVVA